MELKTDSELQSLIPPLSDEEYSLLAKSIISEGCRDSLVVWGETLIDGHNRYEICKKHDIGFNITEKEFAEKNDAKIWIIDNQSGRRNISDFTRYELKQKKAEILRAIGKQTQGQRTDLLPTIGKKLSHNTQEKIAKELGWSKGKVSQADIVSKKATTEIKERLRKNEISINEAYRNIKKESRKALNDFEPQELPKGVYNLVYCDPPWRYEFAETDNRKVENQYPTMDLDELCALTLPEIADNALIAMWATAPKLAEALAVIEAWGFNYKTHGIWNKTNIGMGYWFRGQHELLLIATRGKFSPPSTEYRHPSIFNEVRGKHSTKPEFYYEWLEEAFPNTNKIELFARTKRQGWEAWGNELL